MGIMFLTTGSVVLPFLVPGRWSSVGLGAGSPPFVVWLSLVSYRDVRAASRYAVYPHLQWIHLTTGEGPLAVVATCADRHHRPDRDAAFTSGGTP